MSILPQFRTGKLLGPSPDVSSREARDARSAEAIGEQAWYARPRVQFRIALAFLVFGAFLRLARYLLNFPLWGDETMLAVNFLDRSYLQLALPLDCLQISPILFSWIELSAAKTLGFSSLSLRLFPMLCGLASLGLFWSLARQTCRGLAIPLAMAIFSMSYFLIRHSAEIKPYSSDLCGALLLMVLALKIQRAPSRACWAVLILITPLLVLLSYPIVFVAGGVSLFLLAAADDRKAKSFWLPWVMFNIALVGTFLANYLFIASAHYVRTYTQGVGAMWVEGWPPITRPLDFLTWAVRVHTGRMMSYPVGGKNGASSLTFILFALGAWQLWRNRERRSDLVLFASPFLLGFVAAAIQRYPYGGSARTMLYVAPIICLLAGVGGGWVIERIVRTARRNRMLGTVAIALCLVGGANLIRDLMRPYKTVEDARLDQFAQWFWADYARSGELLCAVMDQEDRTNVTEENAAAHDYLCWQRMYSSRHRSGANPNWDAISKEHPLRIVYYRVLPSNVAYPTVEDAKQLIPAEHRQRLAFAERTVLPVNPHSDVVYSREYVVLSFIPQAAEPANVAGEQSSHIGALR